jgi:hypothetical protein
MTLLKNKKIHAVVLLLLVSLVICSVVYSMRNQKDNNQNNIVDVHYDLRESFDSVDGLYKSATLVAQVTINDTTAFEYGNIGFSLSDANVVKVFKGDLGSENLRILETGGTHDGLIYKNEGNSVFEKSEQAIVFLEKYIGPVAEDAYIIKGLYQGKFIIDGQKVIPPFEVSEDIASVRSISDLKLN